MDYEALALGLGVGVVSLATSVVSKKYIDKAFGHETVTLNHLKKKDVVDLDKAKGKADNNLEESEK